MFIINEIKNDFLYINVIIVIIFTIILNEIKNNFFYINVIMIIIFIIN